MFAEPLKDLLNVIVMVGQVPGVHQDVIDVDIHEPVKVLPEIPHSCSPGILRGH